MGFVTFCEREKPDLHPKKKKKKKLYQTSRLWSAAHGFLEGWVRALSGTPAGMWLWPRRGKDAKIATNGTVFSESQALYSKQKRVLVTLVQVKDI